jgi:hypothetical protein
VAWYSTITVYVAIRGASDIRTMLDRLAAINAEESAADPGIPEER